MGSSRQTPGQIATGRRPGARCKTVRSEIHDESPVRHAGVSSSGCLAVKRRYAWKWRLSTPEFRTDPPLLDGGEEGCGQREP
jgi:hypothetical protein